MYRYLLSELAKKVADAATFDAFFARDACDWLLWDTSVWRPAKHRSDPTTAAGSGGTEAKAPPLLFLSLMLPSGGAECVLGRSVKCDISLNESTLSGRHLTFSRSDTGGWQVEDFGSSNGSTLDGKPIFPPGERRALVDGAVLTAGDVHLTYRTAKSVFQMLKKAP